MKTLLSLMVAEIAVAVLIATPVHAQDRLKSMPGYAQFQKMSRESADAVKSGALTVTWTDAGKSFEFQRDGKRLRFDLATRQTTEVPADGKAARDEGKRPAVANDRRPFTPGPARGRQFTSALSPDGKLKAFHRARNAWLSDANGANEIALTTDGSDASRVKYGSASWVYGEELYQTTALWWATNSQRLAFYRFDESRVPDYFLQLGQTRILSTMDVEPYVKAGGTNPIVDLLIYDVTTKKTIRVDVRDGQPFDNSVVGHYVYGVAWTRDGRELLFHRTNRRQNIMELCAADTESGKVRVVVREEWPASWTENLPATRWLADGRRFIWTSDRTGWKNFYLYDVGGKLIAPLTAHAFEVANIVRVDEAAGLLYYMARDGDNPMKLQLHRVGLDGTGDRRLTDPAFLHTVDIAPDGRHFVDVTQTHDAPPATRVCDTEGKVIAELAQSDQTKFRQLALKPVELLTFKAADGATDLYGMLHFPAQFDAAKKYPLLVSVYGGPETVGARETFTPPNALTEFGFLLATFDSRTASGRGKRFLDAIYEKLGTVEVDDQAAGVKSLWSRPYLDKTRVGIFGTSYGGTMSATCLVRYPEVFQAACSSSPVTDYRNYDSIYAERYMWIPQENKAGYDAAAVMTHVSKMTGRLMLFYGTADNNVHPNNSLQLVQALQRAGKSFDLQVGPDVGHAALNRDRMMEFFIENLVQR